MELKRIFYELFKFSGNFVITGKRILLKPARFTLSELESEFLLRAPRTAG